MHQRTPPLRIRLGATNVYALRSEGGVSLVDAGPDYPGAWQELTAALEAAGIAPADVRRVLLTHHHRDHAGLAARWQQAGARIVIGAADAPLLAMREEQRAHLRELARAELERHGVPSETAATVLDRRERAQDHQEAFGGWPGPLRMTAVTADEVFVEPSSSVAEGGWRALATPGHTPGSVVLRDASDSTLFTGDHLLPNTVATTGLQFDSDDAPWPAMPQFHTSLQDLTAGTFDGWSAWPGHGGRIDDAGAAARWSVRHLDRRAARLAARLTATPQTAMDLAGQIYPHVRPAHLLPVLSEMIGLLALLAERGTAARQEGRLVQWTKA